MKLTLERIDLGTIQVEEPTIGNESSPLNNDQKMPSLADCIDVRAGSEFPNCSYGDSVCSSCVPCTDISTCNTYYEHCGYSAGCPPSTSYESSNVYCSCDPCIA